MPRRSPNTSRRLWNSRRTLCSMCSNCREMIVFGKKRTTRSIMVNWSTGTISNKMEHSLGQMVADIGKLAQSNHEQQTILSCVKVANLVYSTMPHLLVTSWIHNQRQEVWCACSDPTRLFSFRGCARSKPQVLTAAPSLKLFRSTQIYYVWMVDQLHNLGSVCWKRCPVDQSLETLSVANARDSLRLTHFLTLVYLSALTTLRPTFPSTPTQRHSTLSKTMRQWSTKDEAPTKGMLQERTESIWIVCLDDWVWIILFFFKARANNDQQADILTKVKFIHQSSEERSSCRNALRHECGGDLVPVEYSSQILRDRKGLWELVQSTVNCRKGTRQRFTSSQILFCVWKSRRWTCQKSNSTKGGIGISSNTGNPQGELMENQFKSDSKNFFAARRTRQCSKSMNGFGKATQRMDNFYSTNLHPSKYLHGNDEWNFEFFTVTETR